ncbi:aspartate--tRNA(Asn) ligase [Candidatus Dojkabacteria bacterium]|nr:aspartate--tRNA(Asn) ligase [Candidatus Dojkabacteria bacterium]
MKRIISSRLNSRIGEKVRVKGWLNTVRSLGKINFLIIRDRGGFTQIVIENPKEFKKIEDLQPGSVLSIEGEVQKTDQTESGVEISNPSITVEIPIQNVPAVEYTKSEIRADLDTVLDNRAITLRNRRHAAIFKIQAEIVAAYREFLRSEGFIEFFGPTIIGASSEGGAELFTVNYFDHEAKLSQSAQLYKQIMVGVHERVFALMKCYRAEKSNTRRHLTEATQFEFEMGFIEDFTEVMDMLEKTIKYIINHLQNTCKSELELIGAELPKAPEDVKFPRVPFKKALEIVFERTGIDEREEDDLSPMAEKELCKYALREFGTDFVFVPYFLRKKCAFYAKPNEENPEVCNYFDLLCREIEIVSGGQRINDHDELVESLKLKGLDPEDFQDYLSIFKRGMPKHGGFGMGMERLTMMLLGLDNIREATLFPSDPKRIAGNRIKAEIFTGAENVRNEIIRQLKENEFEYEHQEHEPTPTSEDSSKVRGTKPEEGVKAIILKGKTTGKNYQFNLPSQLKMNMKKVAKIVGERCEFEDPKVLEKRFGIVVGGVPPFGNLLGLKTYFDKRILDEERAAFNCGMQTESIIMKSNDLVELVEPEMADFAKS